MHHVPLRQTGTADLRGRGKECIIIDVQKRRPERTTGAIMREESRFSNRVIEIGWLVLAAGLPLCFTPWARNSFELPKTLLLWSVVAVMSAAWLAGQGTNDTRGRLGSKAHSLPYVLVVAILVVLLLSTYFSVNPLTSAQGSFDRMQGTVTQLCYLALFLLTAVHARELSQVRRIFVAIAWGSAPVVIYGLLQLVGLDPLGWRAEGSPIISTLGRGNFVGAYLAFVLPLTLNSAWQAQRGSWRTVYLVLSGAQTVCLVATMAQAAWLGALAVAGVLILAEAWDRGCRRLATAGVIVGMLGLLSVLVALTLIPGLRGSLGARVTIWRATRSLVVARPILGHGLETFGQTFTRVFPPELVYLQGRAVRIDRAHNLILDTLASVGTVGLLAYGALVGTALAAGARAFARAPDRRVRIVSAAGLAAVIGHLVETQFSFQTTTTATLFWLTLGILVALWAKTAPSRVSVPDRRRGTHWLRRGLAAVLLLTVVPSSLILFVAEAYAGKADRTDTLSDLQRSIAAAGRATSLWPNQPVYFEHLSWLHLQRARHGYDSLAEFRAAERALDAARELAPDDYLVWAGYGELYTEWGLAGDPARFAQAENAYRQATALFPGSAMLHTGWGLVYVAQGRLAEAELQFHQAVSLDHTDAWAFLHLGDTQLALGDLDGAEESYYDAVRWAPDMAAAHRGLGHVYRQRGQLEAALEAYQRALDLSPDDPAAHLDVAHCAWDLGQRQLACRTAERGLGLAPDHAELLALRAACSR
jgi:tetratricopeptide (TPR) repeat protein